MTNCSSLFLGKPETSDVSSSVCVCVCVCVCKYVASIVKESTHTCHNS